MPGRILLPLIIRRILPIRTLLHRRLTLRPSPASPLALHRQWLLTARPAAHVWMRGRVPRPRRVPRRTGLALARRRLLLLGRVSRGILPSLRAAALPRRLLWRISGRVLSAPCRASSVRRPSMTDRRRNSKLREGVPAWRTLLARSGIALEDASLNLINATTEPAPDAGASLPNRPGGALRALPDRTSSVFGQFFGAVAKDAEASQCLAPFFLDRLGKILCALLHQLSRARSRRDAAHSHDTAAAAGRERAAVGIVPRVLLLLLWRILLRGVLLRPGVSARPRHPLQRHTVPSRPLERDAVPSCWRTLLLTLRWWLLLARRQRLLLALHRRLSLPSRRRPLLMWRRLLSLPSGWRPLSLSWPRLLRLSRRSLLLRLRLRSRCRTLLLLILLLRRLLLLHLLLSWLSRPFLCLFALWLLWRRWRAPSIWLLLSGLLLLRLLRTPTLNLLLGSSSPWLTKLLAWVLAKLLLHRLLLAVRTRP